MDMNSLVMQAMDKASLFWTVKKLMSGREEVSTQLVLSRPPLLERWMAEEAAQINESLLAQLWAGSLQSLIQTASLSSVCFCLMEVAVLCTEN